MPIIKATTETEAGINSFWETNKQTNEAFKSLTNDTNTTSPTGKLTFSFDCANYKFDWVRTIKMVDESKTMHGCSQIYKKVYEKAGESYNIAIISKFVVDDTDTYKIFGSALIERLIKYAKLHNFHVILSWGRNADYYLNFDFYVLKVSTKMVARRLQTTPLTDEDLLNASGFFGGATTTSSTTSTTTTTTSTITTTSTQPPPKK